MFLSFLVPFRSMVRVSSHPSVDILVLVPYSNHGTRKRMSTDESRASNQRWSTRSRWGFSRRAGSSTRSRRGFSRRAKTRTRSCRGFSWRAKTRTHTRRVLLSPRPTGLDQYTTSVLYGTFFPFMWLSRKNFVSNPTPVLLQSSSVLTTHPSRGRILGVIGTKF